MYNVPDPEKKYPKINPTLVMLKVQQALTDNPRAKYIIVSGYEQYTEEAPQISFNRRLPYLHIAQPETKEKKWIITNLWVPANSFIEAFTGKKHGEQRDPIIVISVPKEFQADVLVRDSISSKQQTLIQNHVLKNFFSLYRVIRPSKKHDVWKVGLTMKNWKLSEKEPDISKTVKFVDYKSTQWYVMSSVWHNKNSTISNMPLVSDSICPSCYQLNKTHTPECPDKPIEF